jgi:phage terminase large subunit-like protein
MILKNQKKDNEAKEWKTLTTWTGIQLMIEHLRALANAIREAMERYKTSELIADRKIATGLAVKLNEIQEIIFRWEQRQSHLSQPLSPKEVLKTTPPIPQLPKV